MLTKKNRKNPVLEHVSQGGEIFKKKIKKFHFGQKFLCPILKISKKFSKPLKFFYDRISKNKLS